MWLRLLFSSRRRLREVLDVRRKDQVISHDRVEDKLGAYNRYLMSSLDFLNLIVYLEKSVLSSLRILGLKTENVHLLIKHFRRKPNVLSGLKLITCEHPDFDPSILEVLNCLGHPFL